MAYNVRISGGDNPIRKFNKLVVFPLAVSLTVLLTSVHAQMRVPGAIRTPIPPAFSAFPIFDADFVRAWRWDSAFGSLTSWGHSDAGARFLGKTHPLRTLELIDFSAPAGLAVVSPLAQTLKVMNPKNGEWVRASLGNMASLSEEDQRRVLEHLDVALKRAAPLVELAVKDITEQYVRRQEEPLGDRKTLAERISTLDGIFSQLLKLSIYGETIEASALEAGHKLSELRKAWFETWNQEANGLGRGPADKAAVAVQSPFNAVKIYPVDVAAMRNFLQENMAIIREAPGISAVDMKIADKWGIPPEARHLSWSIIIYLDGSVRARQVQKALEARILTLFSYPVRFEKIEAKDKPSNQELWYAAELLKQEEIPAYVGAETYPPSQSWLYVRREDYERAVQVLGADGLSISKEKFRFIGEPKKSEDN